MAKNTSGFLPVSAEEMAKRGWDAPDFVYVTGDAYVDHPSFGLAIISRVLEDKGYRVCMLPQPDWHDKNAFMRFGRPKIGFLVTAGVVDSMVNHYTAAKKRRNSDAYSPGGKAGMRPDRATVVYTNRIREAYGNIPVGIGGVEASLRRFAHYDYWDDRVRNSMLVDSGADVLMFGMGENTIVKVAEWMKSGKPFSECDIPGTCVMAKDAPNDAVVIESYEEIAKDKKAYARAFLTQYNQQDPVRGKRIAQKHAQRYLVQNKPPMPLTTKELDKVYALPYARKWHPMYDKEGGVPALQEVEFSIASERGCFGACNFCALTFHQGRIVTSRSKESIIEEGKLLAKQPGFKGYIHDVGGPTANFRHPACDKQLKVGACEKRQCLFPEPCRNVNADHSEYVDILRALRELPNVKKVFVRSGIRYDYMLLDKKNSLMNELVKHHISGQLKVAPEHASSNALKYMGKPDVKVFDEFLKRFKEANKRFNMDQYVIPYFMSSHPGCTLQDAVELAVYMKKNNLHPDQVQDFYPTPGTMSTAMFYTELDPRDMKKVYVAKNPKDKEMQRALMQYERPQNRQIVVDALRRAGRTDLIGRGPECLIPAFSAPQNKDGGKKQEGKKSAPRTTDKKQANDKRNQNPRGKKDDLRGKGKTHGVERNRKR
ncbi:MAG: YgiQ family radical SAM protein [Clostridia bacterium]|nr:YgiQ family radical SAM protein [Clostridia bacterium]